MTTIQPTTRARDRPPSQVPRAGGETDRSAEDLAWEIDVALLRNGTIVGDLLRVCVGSAVLMAGLLSILLFASGEAKTIPAMVVISAAASAGLFVVGLLAMAVIYRGRMRFRYTVTSTSLQVEVVDRTVRTVNRAAVLVGLLAGRPGVAGAGLIASSREMTEVAWRGAFRAAFDPRRRTITFRNAWRRLFVVHATADNYAAVADRVSAEMEVHGTARRARTRRSPLAPILAITAVAAVASLVVFPLADEYDVSTLLLATMLCFAGATIWLVSLFGWVVIGCAVVVCVQVMASLVEARESYFSPGTTYRHVDVLSGDDVAILAIALLGLAVLVGISVAALRGRLPSMLERDATDAGA